MPHVPIVPTPALAGAHPRWMLAVAGLCAALSGCAVVESRPISADAPRIGLQYLLPKALLPVELVETDGVLMLRIAAPVIVGDPEKQFLLSRNATPFASDDVKIEVDPSTGLLKQITATAEDQTLSTLTDLLSAARGLRSESAPLGEETVLFHGILEPRDSPIRPAAGAAAAQAADPNDAMLDALNLALQRRVETRLAGCTTDAARPASATAATTADCAVTATLHRALSAWSTASRTAAPARRVVQVTAEPLRAPAGGAALVDCSIGVCHRPVQPFLVRLAIDGVFDRTEVAMLPNGVAPVALPLPRVAFAKAEHTVVFQNGAVSSAQTVAPSSAAALARWPLDAYEAVLNATASLVQLRIGANEDAVKLAQSELDTQTALKKIQEDLDALKQPERGRAPQPASAGRVSARAPLVSFELGARAVRSGLLPASPATPATPALPGQAGQPGQPGQAPDGGRK